MLDRIKASLPSLAPAEQRVGRLVLSDPRAFANLPISELAFRSHVSKPTVVRFCRSVGYDGLSDFKLKLAGSEQHLDRQSTALPNSDLLYDIRTREFGKELPLQHHMLYL